MRADDVILGKTLREHIGGRWAISWIVVVINIPLNVIGSASNVSDARGVSPSSLLGVWALGYAAFVLVLLVANYTLFRNRRVTPVPIWWVVLLGALAGGVRSAVVALSAASVGVGSASLEVIATRVMTGVLLGAVLLPSAAFVLSVIATSVRTRRDLVAEQVQLRLERMRSEGESERLRQILVADVEYRVSGVLSDDSIRSTRELSHALLREAPPPPSDRIPLGRVLWATLSDYPYPRWIVSGLWSVNAIGTLMVAIGVLRGTAQVLASGLIIALVFTIAGSGRPSSPRVRLAVFVVVVVFLVVVTGPVASFVFDPRPAAAGAGLVLANSVWLPFLIVFVGFIVVALRSEESVIEGLRAGVREEEIAERAAQAEQTRLLEEVAEAIHGVQSRIFAGRLSQDGGAALSISEVLRGVGTDLSPRQLMEELTAKWGTLMDVTVVGSIEEVPPMHARNVVRILSEGLANAYRHGGATDVRCGISVSGESVRVVISDNGRGIATDRVLGMGSAIIDSIAPGAWTLTRGQDQRTILEVALGEGEA